jgi:hypothetical protein
MRFSRCVAAILVSGLGVLPVAAGSVLQGEARALRLGAVLCTNMSTGQAAPAAVTGDAWDCTAGGLITEPGDLVRITQAGLRRAYQQAKLRASDSGAFTYFAESLALDGDTAIFGRPFAFNGQAYVFRNGPGGWVEEQRIIALDGIGGSAQFGDAVELQGNLAFVGSSGNSVDGAVYIFEFDGLAWNQVQKLLPPEGGFPDNFGRTLELEGDRLLVAATFDGSGAVHVYERAGDTWVFQETLRPGDGTTRFGDSMTLEGDVALIGAPEDSGSQGAVYVFRLDGAGWSEEVKLTVDGEALDRFGSSLDLEGDLAVIGASGENLPAMISVGAVYTYRYDGSAWVQEQRLTHADPVTLDQLGSSVAVEGDRLVAGAEGLSTPGAVFVFRNVDGIWVEDLKLVAFDGISEDGLGNAVEMEGSRVLAGAWADMNDSGAAYVFDIAPVGGSAPTVNVGGVLCRNLTAGGSAPAALDGDAWDCEAGGLEIAEGDRVHMIAVGLIP